MPGERSWILTHNTDLPGEGWRSVREKFRPQYPGLAAGGLNHFLPRAVAWPNQSNRETAPKFKLPNANESSGESHVSLSEVLGDSGE